MEMAGCGTKIAAIIMGSIFMLDNINNNKDTV